MVSNPYYGVSPSTVQYRVLEHSDTMATANYFRASKINRTLVGDSQCKNGLLSITKRIKILCTNYTF